MDNRADTLFATPEMAAIWSSEARVRGMLAFEAALAHAEAQAGVIPDEAAAAIMAACRVELFDVAAVYREAALAGTPAIPLVRMLTERVEGAARGFVHWGATSQDALDMAMVLQARAGLDELSQALLAVGASCASLARRHRRTLMAGRTLLQHAVPITFGLKAARWLAVTTRQIRRLSEARALISVAQLGGAAGTLAPLGGAGLRVTELLAGELGLAVPDLPWHAERDRVAEVVATLGVVAASISKIARDLILLAQTEVAEVAEAAEEGKGGSSALPQKRNPVDATLALAAAQLAIGMVPVMLGAMAQEHERAAGMWQAEWEVLPAVFRATSGAVDHVRRALAGLRVDAERMRENITRSGGQIMAEALATALAPHMGRPEAHRVVRDLSEHATQTREALHQAALADERVQAVLSPEEIARACDPARYLGSADTYIDRALADFRALQQRTPRARQSRQRGANAADAT